MLQEMMKSLYDANGVTQDMWLHILDVIGDSFSQDDFIKTVKTYGSRYYLTDPQRDKLRDILPFMAGINLDRVGGGVLSLPAHEPEPDIGCKKCGQNVSRVPDGGFMAYVCTNEGCSYKDIKIRYSFEVSLRCGKCKGPFHSATGHAFSATTVACGPCYGRFAAWQLRKYGWHGPLTYKQLKKLNIKLKKQQRTEKKAAKELAKKLIKEAIEHERLYGKPRDAQIAQEQLMC